MSGKKAELIVVVVLIAGLLSLSGCGAAWISYSKEGQAQQSAIKIQQQQTQIDHAQVRIQEQERLIDSLISDKNNLVADKTNLIDQIKKKGYKITIKSSGGYEIDDASVNDSSETEGECMYGMNWSVDEADKEKQAEKPPPKMKDRTPIKPEKKIGK